MKSGVLIVITGDQPDSLVLGSVLDLVRENDIQVMTQSFEFFWFQNIYYISCLKLSLMSWCCLQGNVITLTDSEVTEDLYRLAERGAVRQQSILPRNK